MQNATSSQMKMLLTRIGKNTRLVITGDCEQNDLHRSVKSGLIDFLDRMKKIASKKEDFPAPFFPIIKFFFARSKEEFLKDLKLFKLIFDSGISS